MLHAHLPGFLLSTAVVAAAVGVYVSIDGDQRARRPIQLTGAPASEVRLPAQAPPRSHRTRGASRRRTGERAATIRGVVRWSAGGVVVPGRSRAYGARGVTSAAGRGARPPLGSAPAMPVTLAPAPTVTPQQATPASSATSPGDGGDPRRVRAPEVAALPEPSRVDTGDAAGAEPSGDPADAAGPDPGAAAVNGP